MNVISGPFYIKKNWSDWAVYRLSCNSEIIDTGLTKRQAAALAKRLNQKESRP